MRKLGFLFLLLLPVIASSQSASTVGDAPGIFTGGSAPTVSACGTSPSAVTGNNFAGRLTTGSGINTTCTLTFVPAFAVAPVCTVSGTFNQSMTAQTTTTTLVITAADLTSRSIAYICARIP